MKSVSPAVVNVYASRVQRQVRNPLMDDPFFRRFFGGDQGGIPRERTQRSLGSGVIVDASGFVVTNNHVIENMTEVKVALADKREFEAEIVLRDPRTDLAVLRIKAPEKFVAVEIGDSDTVEVGDLVLAVGNPLRCRPDRHLRHRLRAGAHAVGVSDSSSSSRPTRRSIPAIRAGRSSMSSGGSSVSIPQSFPSRAAATASASPSRRRW